MQDELSKEYKVLFNAVSYLINGVRCMQIDLMKMEQQVSTGKEINLQMLRSLHNLIARCQSIQMHMILAQQKAEDYYLESGE